MLATYNEFKKKHPRITNNVILAEVSLVGCLIAALVVPGQSAIETLSIGTGYVGLALIALTLLIGPLNMRKVRKNPVNMMFRRDAGIWAGITSLLHVGFATLVQYDWGGTLLGFFFYKEGDIKLNLFGISNYLGLLGALVLVFLLVLSNNHFLKKLKGKLWKNMQRFNYLLFTAAVLHTFTQQVNNMRGAIMIAAVTGVTLAVMVAQSIGFVVYRRREQARKVGPVAKPAAKAAPAMAVPQSHIAPPPVRSFGKLKIASAVGMVALLGVGVGLEGLNLMNSQATAAVSNAPSDEVATVPSTATPTAAATATTAPTATATAATSTTAASATTSSTTAAATATATQTAAATATATPAATATATAAPTATATAAPTTAAASSSKTTVTQPSSSGGTTHTGRS